MSEENSLKLKLEMILLLGVLIYLFYGLFILGLMLLVDGEYLFVIVSRGFFLLYLIFLFYLFKNYSFNNNLTIKLLRAIVSAGMLAMFGVINIFGLIILPFCLYAFISFWILRKKLKEKRGGIKNDVKK